MAHPRRLPTALLLTALACGGDAPPPAEPAPRPLRVHAYDCEGLAVVADVRAGDPCWLFLPRRTLRLPRVRAASGAKYVEGDVVFWTHGAEARLEIAGAEPRRCVEDRRRSLREEAKLRGVAFRATGNEPGWVLELSPDTIRFEYAYGAARVVRPAVEPQVDAAAERSVFYADPLHVVLEGLPCVDDMSGEAFEATVEVRLAGRVFRGCGQALH